MSTSKNLTTIPIPRKYQELIIAEQEKLGVCTYAECMGRILAFYFERQEEPEIKQEVDNAKDTSNLPEVPGTYVD